MSPLKKKIYSEIHCNGQSFYLLVHVYMYKCFSLPWTGTTNSMACLQRTLLSIGKLFFMASVAIYLSLYQQYKKNPTPPLYPCRHFDFDFFSLIFTNCLNFMLSHYDLILYFLVTNELGHYVVCVFTSCVSHSGNVCLFLLIVLLFV